MARLKRWAKRAAIGLVGLFVLIQLVPYGRDHTNPPVVAEPSWDSPQTRALAVGACFDCHSNETEWPWYSNVAPISWSLQNHVEEGRDKLNFSEWGRDQEADESAETVRDGSMPPLQYKLAHSAARLSDEDRAALERGLAATFGDESSGDDN